MFWLTARKGKIIIRKTKEQGRRGERARGRGDEGTRGRRDEGTKLRKGEVAGLQMSEEFDCQMAKLALKLYLFLMAQYARNIQFVKKRTEKIPF